MRISILYHYFHPDDVISAQLFSDLARHLAGKGHEVQALPCRRGCRDESRSYPGRETWEGVRIRRIWRPAFSQKSSLGRIMNAIWMICAWALKIRVSSGRAPDVVIVGTDPPCSAAVTSMFRRGTHRPKFICWLHDLYPEVAAVGGIMNPASRFYRGIANVVKHSYRTCTAVADIGPVMREKLPVDSKTITPWATYEPEAPCEADPITRKQLFGDARLGLIYSGNFGRAHDCGILIRLAEALKDDGVALAFSARGNCVKDLESHVAASTANIKVVPFKADPAKHFAAADIHMVSLKEEWSGMVVPSKYFGALAVGRPVLYAGPEHSDIARWTKELNTGWVLNEESFSGVVDELRNLVGKSEKLRAMGGNAFRVYHENFSKERMLAKWDALIEKCGTGKSA